MLTKSERKEIARVLTKALKLIPNESTYNPRGGSPYICDNVWKVEEQTYAGEQICAIIAERLEHKFSVYKWLLSQSEEISEQVRDDVWNNRGRKLQAYRKAWVKELIKEFSS